MPLPVRRRHTSRPSSSANSVATLPPKIRQLLKTTTATERGKERGASHKQADSRTVGPAKRSFNELEVYRQGSTLLGRATSAFAKLRADRVEQTIVLSQTPGIIHGTNAPSTHQHHQPVRQTQKTRK